MAVARALAAMETDRVHNPLVARNHNNNIGIMNGHAENHHNGDDSPSNNEKSVKELKQWLTAFGKKHQDRYNKGRPEQQLQQQQQPKKIMKAKISEIEMKLQIHSPSSLTEARRRDSRRFRATNMETSGMVASPECEDSVFQPPPSVLVPHQTSETGVSDSLSGSWGEFDSEFPLDSEPPTPMTHMHSTKFFHEKALTAERLDFICKVFDNDRKPDSPNKSETGTTSLTSVDSEMPSVNADAVDSKLAKVFHASGDRSIFRRGKRVEPRPSSPVGVSSKKENGKENEDHGKMEMSKSRFTNKPVIHNTFSKEVVPQKIADEALQRKLGKVTAAPIPLQQPPPMRSNKPVLRKFGGENRSPLMSSVTAKKGVAQRQEELQRLFAQSKAPKVVTKVKWQVDAKTGTYKKKVTLENLE